MVKGDFKYKRTKLSFSVPYFNYFSNHPLIDKEFFKLPIVVKPIFDNSLVNNYHKLIFIFYTNSIFNHLNRQWLPWNFSKVEYKS